MWAHLNISIIILKRVSSGRNIPTTLQNSLKVNMPVDSNLIASMVSKAR
jgi:hypothetical protein